jgi:hypothetical protein
MNATRAEQCRLGPRLQRACRAVLRVAATAGARNGATAPCTHSRDSQSARTAAVATQGSSTQQRIAEQGSHVLGHASWAARQIPRHNIFEHHSGHHSDVLGRRRGVPCEPVSHKTHKKTPIAKLRCRKPTGVCLGTTTTKLRSTPPHTHARV